MKGYSTVMKKNKKCFIILNRKIISSTNTSCRHRRMNSDTYLDLNIIYRITIIKHVLNLLFSTQFERIKLSTNCLIHMTQLVN